MYRFLLRPRWLAFHLGVAVLIFGMMQAGFWQLRRLDERRDRNALVEERATGEAVALASVLSASGTEDDGRAVEWQRVTATGTYDAGAEVLWINRSQNGLPGFFVLTPLVLGDGTGLFVNRGFLPLAAEEQGIRPEPPAGTVTVTGRVRHSQHEDHLAQRDPDEGVLTEVARADMVRLQDQVPYDLFPAYVELDGSVPSQGDLPDPVPPPEQGDGPHLGYAIQWFAFCVIAVVGWVLLVRKSTQEEAAEAAAGAAGADPRGAAGVDADHDPVAT